MNCGTILFIYDRPQCTQKVLEALKRNHIKELYVFQDGIGEKTDTAGWKRNEAIINEIDWCTVHFEQNTCKADCLDVQIAGGINKVFEQKEEIIVIEDDCVVSDDCIAFMETCLETYRHNKNVLDISAYLEPITVPSSYTLPVLAAGIPAGWGWGTWKDRWEEFRRDYAIIERMGKSMKSYKGFSGFGYTVKKILTDYWLLGTWDLWWSIYVLEKQGISVRPVENKVYNIGFENPGTHTAGESPWVVPISNEKRYQGRLPEDIKIEPWAETEFARFYKSVSGGKSLEERQTYYRYSLEKWVAFKQRRGDIRSVLSEKDIHKVAIYGIGTIGGLLLEELSGQAEVICFIVTDKKTDNFMGYPVFGCKERLPEELNKAVLIIIPGYDIDEIKSHIKINFANVYSLDSLFG